MKKLLFSPVACSLAEVTRTLEIAKACRDHFEILFCSFGGQYEYPIEKEGFKIYHLEPQLTPEKVDHLYKIDQGQKFGYFFSTAEVRQQVKNEIKLIEALKPAAVVTGFSLGNSISCRVTHTPLVWLTHSTWMFQAMYAAGLATHVDMLDVPVLRWFPERLLKWGSQRVFSLLDWSIRPYDAVAREYGLAPFKTLERLWEGDYNLIAEPEEFCELPLPSSYHYIAPLIARLDTPIPEVLLNIPNDFPIVYFAMGSSGQPAVIAKIIEGFAGKPYRVIAPVRQHLEKIRVNIPENVILTDWLPAHKVNPMADISLIHGGIGTLMTACLAGTPVVGISMMPEQQFNIDCLVRKGFAIRISKNRFTPQKICTAIENLLKDAGARKKAKDFQRVVQRWDNPSRITDFFRETFQ